MWLYLPKLHKNWNPFDRLILELHTLLHYPKIASVWLAIDGHVFFHSWLFADPVKPWKCTTGTVEPVSGINKDMSGAKLLLTTISTYSVNCVRFCHLMKTQHCCLCTIARHNLPLAAHPPPPPTPSQPHPPPYIYCPWYYSSCEKSYSKSSSVSQLVKIH